MHHPVSKKQLEINANWTSATPRQGWRHYRISARRHGKSGLELEMMAVCDRLVRFWVSEEELRRGDLWKTGWSI